MDEATRRFYERSADVLGARYRDIDGGIAQYFDAAFPTPSRLVDIGAGTGRDMQLLLERGHTVVGVEPTPGMRRVARERHLGPDAILLDAALPHLEHPQLTGPFDGALCSAVLQHLPPEDLPGAASALAILLRPGGRLLVSIPDARPGITEARDPDGRLFSGLTPDQLDAALSAAGFDGLGRWCDPDGLGRPGHSWHTLLWERR